MNEELRKIYGINEATIPRNKDDQELEFRVLKDEEDEAAMLAIGVNGVDYIYNMLDQSIDRCDGLSYEDFYQLPGQRTMEEYFERVQEAWDIQKKPEITSVRDSTLGFIFTKECIDAMENIDPEEAKDIKNYANAQTGTEEKNKRFFAVIKEWFEERKQEIIAYWEEHKPSAKKTAAVVTLSVAGVALVAWTMHDPVSAEGPLDRDYGRSVIFEPGDYNPNATLDKKDESLKPGDGVVYQPIEENVDHIIPDGGTLEESKAAQDKVIESNYNKDMENSTEEKVIVGNGDTAVEEDKYVVKDVVERLPENTPAETKPTETQGSEQTKDVEIIESVETETDKAQEVVETEKEQNVKDGAVENLRDAFDKSNVQV